MSAVNQNIKVFCIGANKTGTTSLMEFLNKYTKLKIPHQKKQELYFQDNNFENLIDINSIKYFIDQYDAFNDFPFSFGFFWQTLVSLYPESKFILSIRNSDEWYNSLVNWIIKASKKSNRDHESKKLTFQDFINIDWVRYKYSLDVSLRNYLSRINLDTYLIEENASNIHDKEYMINLYNNRNEHIIRFFHYMRPNNLYVHDIENIQPGKLIQWLNLGIDLNQNFSFPHLNFLENKFKKN